MKIIKFQRLEKVNWGILENDKVFELSGNLYAEFKKGKEVCNIEEVRLLAPAEPTIMVCCGMNYMERFKENYTGGAGLKPTSEPIIFFKPATAVIGPLEDIIFPSIAETLRFEAELCAVIKRPARYVPEKEARDYILGYTCGNELGAMDLMKRDKWMTRAKGFDTSGCLGPCLVTDIDPNNISIRSSVNGEKKQDSNTRFMTFTVDKLLSFISEFMTLRPGDVIWTGSPEGACNVIVGDTIEIEMSGIGILKNRVARSSKNK